jgi:uncharacterized protein DUF5655
MPQREENYYERVANYLGDENKGMGCFATAQKKGNQGLGIADVIGVRHVGGHRSNAFEVIVVEVKLSKRPFGKKVGQALGYSLFAHRCYLAVPDEFDLVQRQFAAQLGVGLMEMHGSRCTEVVSAAAHHPDESQMLDLLKQMKLAKCSICGALTKTPHWRPTTRASVARRRSIPYVLHQTRRGGRLFVCPDCVRSLGVLGADDERLIQDLLVREGVSRKIRTLLDKLRTFVRTLDSDIEERPAKSRIAFALGRPFLYVYPKKQGFLRIKAKGGKSRGKSYRVPTERAFSYLKQDAKLAWKAIRAS